MSRLESMAIRLLPMLPTSSVGARGFPILQRQYSALAVRQAGNGLERAHALKKTSEMLRRRWPYQMGTIERAGYYLMFLQVIENNLQADRMLLAVFCRTW